MEQYLQVLAHSDKFLILLARISGLGFAPVFSTRSIPASWKALFVILLSFFTWNMGVMANTPVPQNTPAYMLLLASEVTIGMVLSLFVQFFFAAVQLAGEIIDVQVGFSMMNVLDPLSGIQAPLLGNFKYILALLVYLQIDGHHFFIQALVDSYRVIPAGELAISGPFMQFMIGFFSHVLVLALQLAIPIIGALLITDIILGIMSRTIPQMNIFMVGMPAKILLGFGILLVIVPLYIYLLNSLLGDMLGQINRIMPLLR